MDDRHASRSRYSRPQKPSKSSQLPKDEAPGVSIIRPLRGIDCNMHENLASSFQQDYPRFEITFSVAQANDPAIQVVQDLMDKFPKVDARLVIGMVPQGQQCNCLIRALVSLAASFGCHNVCLRPTRRGTGESYPHYWEKRREKIPRKVGAKTITRGLSEQLGCC